MLQLETEGIRCRAFATTHIEIDERGVAWITDANTKVIEVILDRVAYWMEP